MADAGVTLGGLEARVIKIMQQHQKYLSNPNGRDDEGEEHSDRSAVRDKAPQRSTGVSRAPRALSISGP